MAEAKPKKNPATPAKKIVDVKSGGDAASGTSKPVIVTNRPILKDPMMAEVSELTGGLEGEKQPVTAEPAIPAPEAPSAPVLKKVAIKVDSHGDQPNTPEPVKTEDKPAASPSKKKIVIQPLSKAAPKAEETNVVAETEPAPTIAELAKPDPLPESAAALPKKEVAEAQPLENPEESPETEAQAEKTAEETPTPEDQPAVEDEVITGVQPGESFDETAASAIPNPEQTGVDEKGNAKKKTKKSGDLTAEQQKAIENGEYFLPITTAETKRLRREIIIAVLLVLAMIAIWLNVMLDANLLELNGIKPLTDFFE